MITALNEQREKETVRQLRVRKGSFSDFQNVYSKLSDFIEKINLKIVSRIQLVQQIYLDDYKEQVQIMSTQLKKIRAIMDEELIKQRCIRQIMSANQRLFFLEEERDFFRAQVMKLNGDLQRVIAQNNQLKTQVQEKNQQIENYRKITYNLQTKIFKIKNQSMQVHKLKQTFDKQPLNYDKHDHDLPSTDRYRKDSNHFRSTSNMNKTTKIKPSKSVRTYPKPQIFKDQTSQRQQVIDDCLKEVKKQIYYRNLNLNQTAKIHFNQTSKVPFSKFTKTDKKQLIYKLISDPKILEDFYDYLFDRRTAPQEKPERLAKLSDAKFNTKTLLNIKAQFNKKIFDLKVNN